MLIGEYLYTRHCKVDSSKILFGYNIPPWMWSAYEKVGVQDYFHSFMVRIMVLKKYC